MVGSHILVVGEKEYYEGTQQQCEDYGKWIGIDKSAKIIPNEKVPTKKIRRALERRNAARADD